jgi:ribonuclease E
VLEGSTVPCPHCAGAGTVRSTASIALHVLRVLEDALIKSSAHDVILRTRTVVALYILNQKRVHLQALERRFGVVIIVSADDSLTGTAYHALERGEPASGVREPASAQQPLRAGALPVDLVEEEEVEEPAESETPVEEDGPETRGADRAASSRAPLVGDDGSESLPRSRRRRRRRGRGGGSGGETVLPGAEQPSDEGLAVVAQIGDTPAHPGEGARLSERSGRGGRRRTGRWTRSTPLPPEFRDQGAFPLGGEGEEAAPTLPLEAPEPVAGAPESVAPVIAEESSPTPATVEARVVEAPAVETPSVPAETAEATDSAETRAPAAPARETAVSTVPREPTQTVITHADPDRPKKGGWWQRAKASLGGE